MQLPLINQLNEFLIGKPKFYTNLVNVNEDETGTEDDANDELTNNNIIIKNNSSTSDLLTSSHSNTDSNDLQINTKLLNINSNGKLFKTKVV